MGQGLRPRGSLRRGRRHPIDIVGERKRLGSILEEVGAIALHHFHSVRASLKPDGSQVTVADVAVEKALTTLLREHYPTCGIRAEEGERVSGTAGTWYVDPIDGTGAFLDGLAHWGPSICLVDDEGPVVGATWFPLVGELYYARRGHGAYRNGVRLAPEPLVTIRRNHCILVPSRFHRLPALDWPGKARGLGSTAAHLALVAAGGPVATVIGDEWRMWDVGAGSLMVREAGLSIVDIQGDVYHPTQDRGTAFIAGSPAAIEILLPLFQSLQRTV